MRESTTADSSGNGNTCTLGSGTANPAWIAGQVGSGALDFDGTDDRVDCGNGSSLNISGSAVTIAARVNTDSATNVRFLVTKPNGVNSGQVYGLQWVSSQRVRMLIRTGGVESTRDTNTNLSAATWYSIVGVYNGTDMRVYVNGSLDATPLSKTGNLNTHTDGVRMAVGNNSPTNTFFAGLIDDVRIWSRGLSSTDVSEYHSNTVPCGGAAVPVKRRLIFMQERMPWHAWISGLR